MLSLGWAVASMLALHSCQQIAPVIKSHSQLSPVARRNLTSPQLTQPLGPGVGWGQAAILGPLTPPCRTSVVTLLPSGPGELNRQQNAKRQ